MAFEAIENVRPSKGQAPCPADGVSVRARHIKFATEAEARWIEIQIGRELANRMVLVKEEIGVRVAVGNGAHAGQIALQVDASAGAFAAKRRKDGSYVATMNAASCAGLFSLSFAAFAATAKVTHVQNEPPQAVFIASAAMLDADD